MNQLFLFNYEYEKWACEQVFEAVLKMKEIPDRAKQLISHILTAQQIWHVRLTGDEFTSSAFPEIDSSEWMHRLDSNMNNMKQYIHSISEVDFKNIITYTNTKGDVFKNSVEEILMHITHHSAYHRGQIIQLIRPFIDQPPATDFISYCRNLRNKT
jgi:uncharacterized damage-inducible protein DinB